jgi:hypothetical protein
MNRRGHAQIDFRATEAALGNQGGLVAFPGAARTHRSMWKAWNAAEHRGQVKVLVEKRRFGALGYCAVSGGARMM